MFRIIAIACGVLFSQIGIAADQDADAAGRAKMAEMMAFIRQGAEICHGAAPDAWVFETFGLYSSIKPPVSEEEIAGKEEYLNGLRSKIGDKKWCELFGIEMSEAHMIVEWRTKNR